MAQINNDLETLKTSRDDMKSALEGKGQTVTNDIRTYADAITNIESGGSEDLPVINNLDLYSSAEVGEGNNSYDTIDIGAAQKDGDEWRAGMGISNILLEDEKIIVDTSLKEEGYREGLYINLGNVNINMLLGNLLSNTPDAIYDSIGLKPWYLANDATNMGMTGILERFIHVYEDILLNETDSYIQGIAYDVDSDTGLGSNPEYIHLDDRSVAIRDITCEPVINNETFNSIMAPECITLSNNFGFIDYIFENVQYGNAGYYGFDSQNGAYTCYIVYTYGANIPAISALNEHGHRRMR